MENQLQKAESLILSSIPQALCCGLVKLRDAECVDELTSGKPIPDFENLEFKIASGLTKIPTGNFKKKKVTTAEGKVQQEKKITYWQTDRLDDLRLLQNQWRQ